MPTALTTQQMTAAANADYWDGAPAIEGIEVLALPDAQARVSAVQNGEADIALAPPPEARRQLDGDDRATYRELDIAHGSGFIRINAAGPLEDVDVRRALVLAVDYDSPPDLTDGAYRVATSFYPPEYDFAIDNVRSDVEEATELLDGAGWVEGADGVRTRDGETLSVSYVFGDANFDPAGERFGIALQEQLGAVGFDVEVVEVESTGESELPQDWGMKLHGLAVEGTTNDPSSVLTSWFVDDETGPTTSPELTQIRDDLQSGEGDRDELLRRAQEIIVEEEAWAFVLGHRAFPVVTSPALDGYEPVTRLIFVSDDLGRTGG